MHFVEQNCKLNGIIKTKWNQTLCFSWYKNRKLKVKLWWVEARERKKRTFFCTVYFTQRKFFKDLCPISMYGVLNTTSEYTYFYTSKNITSYTFCWLFLKSSKAFSVSLMSNGFTKIKFFFFYFLVIYWISYSMFYGIISRTVNEVIRTISSLFFFVVFFFFTKRLLAHKSTS